MIPTASSHTTRGLRKRVRVLALRALLQRSPSLFSDRRSAGLAALQRVLQRATRVAPAAVLDALGNLDVLCPLLALQGGARPATELLTQAIPPLLAGLAQHGQLSEQVLWDYPLPALVDVRSGRLHSFQPAARALLANPSGLEVLDAEGTIQLIGTQGATRPFHPLSAHPRLHLSEYDSNPLAMSEAHPDKQGNALSLGERPVGDWVEALEAALALIRLGLPLWYAELPYALERVVPVGYEPQRHLSASYREAPGLIYLSLHPSTLTMAEALVHETQHGKLNLLSWTDPVLHNAYSHWTPSPVRPDLRPLWGVLLALHAFVPVALLHRALAAQGHPLAAAAGFDARRDEVHDSNARALAILEQHAQPTAIGARLLATLARLHRASVEL